MFRWLPHLIPSAFADVFRNASERFHLLFLPPDRGACPEDHRRLIVHRMMKCRARQYQSAHRCHGNAYPIALCNVLLQPTRGRAVEKQAVVVTCIQSWNHIYMPVAAESHMAEECIVKNCVN